MLDCLEFAGQHEPIGFRRRLTALFPDSFDLALAEIRALIRGGYPTQAVQLGSALLARVDLNPHQVRLVHAERLSAAGRSGSSAEFAADFLDLWGRVVGPGKPIGGRLALLRKIVEIGSPRLLAALAVIESKLPSDPNRHEQDRATDHPP